jgi:hypothetical protein
MSGFAKGLKMEFNNILDCISAELEDDLEQNPPKRCKYPRNGDPQCLTLAELTDYSILVSDMCARLRRSIDDYEGYVKRLVEERNEPPK